MGKASNRVTQVPGASAPQAPEPDAELIADPVVDDEQGPGTGLDLDAVGDKAEAAVDPEAPAEPAGEPGQSDIEAALAAGQAGEARPIPTVRAPVAPAVMPRPDPERKRTAAVNQAATMTYAEAMASLNAGTLERSVLTERGWVAAPVRNPADMKR
jgi:hypothetical protein